MTQYKTSKFERSGVPGLSMMNDLVTAYTSMWDRQAHALDEVWSACTCDEATVSDWPKAWNTLFKTWTDSAQEFCNAFISHGFSHAGGGAPLVTFVIDRSAEIAGPESVLLPPDVDPLKLVATPLVSLTYDGHSELDPKDAVVLLLPFKGRLEIRVAMHVPRLPIKPGHYLSVVCEPKAGAPPLHPLTNSPDPPPRPVVATVLVVFI
jgi:hypothetical protein